MLWRHAGRRSPAVDVLRRAHAAALRPATADGAAHGGPDHAVRCGLALRRSRGQVLLDGHLQLCLPHARQRRAADPRNLLVDRPGRQAAADQVELAPRQCQPGRVCGGQRPGRHRRVPGPRPGLSGALDIPVGESRVRQGPRQRQNADRRVRVRGPGQDDGQPPRAELQRDRLLPGLRGDLRSASCRPTRPPSATSGTSTRPRWRRSQPE